MSAPARSASRDPPPSQVRVGGEHGPAQVGERPSVVEVAQLVAVLPEVGEAGQEVVPFQVRDAQADPEPGQELAQPQREPRRD